MRCSSVDKSPASDGLTIGFCGRFWEHIKGFVYSDETRNQTCKILSLQNTNESCGITFRFCSRPLRLLSATPKKLSDSSDLELAHRETLNRNKTHLLSFIRLSRSNINVQIVK